MQRGAAKKALCVRGHELAGANMRHTKIGKRCALCVVIAAKERDERRKAAVIARGPLPPRPRKLTGTCAHGHPMRFNGSRLICDSCSRARYERCRSL